MLDCEGIEIPATSARGIVITHVPMTTFERFVRKVDNAREFFRNFGEHYPGGSAFHWKRWIDLADRGLLAAEFEAHRMDDSEITRLINSGALERAAAVLNKTLQTSADHESSPSEPTNP